MPEPTPADWVRIASGDLAAAINPHGSELSVLQDARGRDLLWNGDAAWWAGRAPILFPVVGALEGGVYRWRGREYALPRHGFARQRSFGVLRQDAQSAAFVLRADDATRSLYPFDFELELGFAVLGARLDVVATVRNAGSRAMPASLGFHPAFRWPLPGGAAREDHVLQFPQEEPAGIRRLDAQGLLRAAAQPTPVQGSRLVLDDALFRDDVVIFDRLHSRSVVYGAARGPRLRIGFPDATHLGVWTRPGAGFVCVEPWRGVADPEGFEGEFAEKPGILTIEPGGEARLTMSLELEGEG